MSLEVIYVTRHGVSSPPTLSQLPPLPSSPIQASSQLTQPPVPIQLGRRPKDRRILHFNPLTDRYPLRPSPSRLRRNSILRTRLPPQHHLSPHPTFLQLPLLPLHPNDLALRNPPILQNASNLPQLRPSIRPHPR